MKPLLIGDTHLVYLLRSPDCLLLSLSRSKTHRCQVNVFLLKLHEVPHFGQGICPPESHQVAICYNRQVWAHLALWEINLHQ